MLHCGLVLLALGGLMSPALGAPTLRHLSVEPVTGDVVKTGPNDWVGVVSHRLNKNGENATGILANITNFDPSADASGRLSTRLLTLDGRVVESGNVTVFVQRNQMTARCSVSFDTARPPSSFALVAVAVNTTVDVSRQAADCTSRGRRRA